MQRWLERIPFLDQGQYHFWQAYKEAAEALLARDKAAIQANPLLNEEVRALLAALGVKRFGLLTWSSFYSNVCKS